MAERKFDTHRVNVLHTIMEMNVAGEQGACFHTHATCAKKNTQQSNAQNTQDTHPELQKGKATQRVQELPTAKKTNQERTASTFPADLSQNL